MKDNAEQSIPSRGSHGEPMAWAVLRIDGSVYDVYRNEEEAKAIDEAVTGNHGIVPLYRRPQTVVIPPVPDDFDMSEGNGYAAAVVDFKRALAEAGIKWTV